jgi:hypothetical protein
MTHWCLISVAFVLELGWSLMWSAPLVMGSALVCLCVRQAPVEQVACGCSAGIAAVSCAGESQKLW